MNRLIVQTDKAPAAIGPYSQAIAAPPFLYTSGQIGISPETAKLVEGGVEAEARQALENVKAILSAAEVSLDRVIKVTIYLADISCFSVVNSVYAEFFPENPPARSVVGVAALPLSAAIEIEAIAAVASQ